MRMGFRAVIGITALAAVLACGGDGGGSSGGAVKINAATPSGDFLMSGTVGLVGGKLQITLSAIRDPDDATRPADPTKVTLTVASGAPSSFSCDIKKVSTASGSKMDLVFINDTTGSMSGTVNGIATSVQTFADSLIAAGVDANFSMYTYGDAFATKKTTGSTFVVGKGDFAPPTIDTTERPYVGLTDITNFKAFLAEMKASGVLGVGGGDGPENTIGAIDYANAKVAYRAGAGKVIIAIGDNPSHQQGDGVVASWPVEFQPKTGDDLVARFKGTTAIHVVGNNTTSPGTNYNLKSLADGTGGVFIQLPSGGNVDLTALHLNDWFTNSFAGTCTGGPKGTYTVTVTAKVTALSGVKTGTLVFDIVVS